MERSILEPQSNSVYPKFYVAVKIGSFGTEYSEYSVDYCRF